MKIRSIMTSKVISVSPDKTAQDAAQLMNIHDIGMLPVIDEGRVLGVLTDRDIAIRVLARGWSPIRTEVREIMSEDIIWCYDDLDALEAAHRMADKGVRRLVVFNHEMRLCGVVSMEDIALALRDERALGQMVRDISCPIVAARAAA